MLSGMIFRVYILGLSVVVYQKYRYKTKQKTQEEAKSIHSIFEFDVLFSHTWKDYACSVGGVRVIIYCNGMNGLAMSIITSHIL